MSPLTTAMGFLQNWDNLNISTIEAVLQGTHPN